MRQKKLSPQAQCHGKHPFLSIRTAVKACREMRKERVRLRPYRCPHCHRWHLGSVELQAIPPRRIERHPYRDEFDMLL